MSDANLPQSDRQPLPDQPPVAEVETPTIANPFSFAEDDWVTVDFPEAVSVDALERESEAPDHKLAELQEQNASLLSRLAYLEEALDEARGALLRQDQAGREQARNQAALVARHNQEMAASQERISQLFQELELSHQTSQRQQILIETLTMQLQTSQERSTQLEQELVLAQQRYGEQVQVLMQTEDQCRDLRIRLQRQQRYTMQFKVALEKCLEMPAHQSQTSGDQLAISGEATAQPAIQLPIDLPIPRSQPVQPWSTTLATAALLKFPPLEPLETPEVSTSSVAVPGEAYAKLADLKISVSSQPESSASSGKKSLALPSLAGLLSSEPVEAAGDHPQAQESIPTLPEEELAWDVDADLDEQWNEVMQTMADTPLLEDEEMSRQEEQAVVPLVAEPSEDQLWQSLSSFIATSPEMEEKADVVSPIEPVAATMPSEESLDLWADDGEVSQTPAMSSATPEPAPVLVTAASPEVSSNSPVSSGSWPSPVVYPLRSGKKRASLAAVELPSFPKAVRN